MTQAILSCPHFPRCSGCRSIGTDYAAQVRAKLDSVRKLFKEAKLGGFSAERIETIHPSPDPAAYRNRARLALSGGSHAASGVSLGLYRAGTHDVVDIPNCPVQLAGINETVEAIRGLLGRHAVSLYDESTQRGDLRYVSVREGERTGEQLVGLVTRSAVFPQGKALADELIERRPGVVGVLQNINPALGNVIFGPTTSVLAGRDHLEEVVCGVRVRLGLTSFFQINTTVAEMAYTAIVDHLALTPADTLLDLYCGVGVIGQVAARHVGRVIGIEETGEAVALARAGAELNGLTNTEFEEALVESWLPGFSMASAGVSGGDRLAVTVNPPRKGLDASVIDRLLVMRPSRIAYLSCSPATLLRDVQRFTQGGYRVDRVELFDMFPQTEQVETLVVMRSSG